VADLENRQLADAEAVGRDLRATGQGIDIYLGRVALLRKRPTEALEIFRGIEQSFALTGESMALHSLGRYAESRAALERFASGYSGQASHTRELAEVNAWLGESSESSKWLRRSLQSPRLEDLMQRFRVTTSAFFDGVANDPRFRLTRESTAWDGTSSKRSDSRSRFRAHESLRSRSPGSRGSVDP
jgi:hypothetical protein